MKSLKIAIAVLVGALAAGCYNDFDTPAPRKIYTDSDMETLGLEQVSIKEVKGWFESAFGSISGTGTNDNWKTTNTLKFGDLAPEETKFEGMKGWPDASNKYIKGKVISVSPTECTVSVDGSKHTGVVKLSEMTRDPNAKMEDLVKVDDELDLVVVKTNDQEGVDTLSRVRFEAQKGMKDVSEACENGTIMEGDVMEANKGGVVVNVKGVRVFVPASQTGLPRDTPMSQLVKQKVRLRITEVNRARKRVVGSIRAVEAEERAAKALTAPSWTSAAWTAWFTSPSCPGPASSTPLRW